MTAELQGLLQALQILAPAPAGMVCQIILYNLALVSLLVSAGPDGQTQPAPKF